MRLDKQFSREEIRNAAKKKAEIFARHDARITAAQQAIPKIDEAWINAMGLHAPSGTPQMILESFNNEVKEVLDQTELTRNWSESDLAPLNTDHPPKIRHSPVDDITPWRNAYFRLAIAGILADMETRWTTPEGELFWKRMFPTTWSKLIAETNGNLAPPLSPSIHSPNGNATAKTSQYHDYANQVVLKRIRELFSDAPPEGSKYDPDDSKFFPHYCLHLTGLSTHLSALRLNLCDKGVGLPDVIENLFDETVDPFKRLTRHRADSQLWPLRYKLKKNEEPDPEKRKLTLRRVYADLQLRPVLRQVLNYAPSALQPTVLTLLMMEANGRSTGKEYVYNELKRSDIELAVWCETIMTILDAPILVSLPKSGNGTEPFFRKYDMNLIPGLPKYRHCLAEDLKRVSIEKNNKRISEKAAKSLDNSRFAAPEFCSHQDIRTILAQQDLQLNEDATLLPTWLTTPVLEENDLRINIEWSWIASSPADAEWMELYLLVLTGPESTIAVIEYEEVEAEYPDADEPLHLRLVGEKWQQLLAQYNSSSLAAAFGEALFCRMDIGLGTGVFVLGMIDLHGAQSVSL